MENFVADDNRLGGESQLIIPYLEFWDFSDFRIFSFLLATEEREWYWDIGFLSWMFVRSYGSFMYVNFCTSH